MYIISSYSFKVKCHNKIVLTISIFECINIIIQVKLKVRCGLHLLNAFKV